MSLYLLYGSYTPGKAYANRAVAFLKAFSEKGINATACFFFPDRKRSKITETVKGISFLYFWESRYIDNPVLKYLSYLYYIRRFKMRLNPGDIVYIYDNPDLLRRFVKEKDIHVYYEVTEHPNFSPPRSRLWPINLSSYYKWCQEISGLFVISTALKECYANHGIPESKIHIINMTVDMGRFKGIPKTTNEVYVGYCGTIINEKDGVDYLIRAFSLLVKHHPHVKLYIIGGNGKDKDIVEDKQLVKTLGITDEVVFTGLVAPTEMPKLLCNATMLALSRPDNLQAANGFPTKLGEYLATSNPVVVTSVGDIPLFLKDKESALLANPNDYISFYEKMN